MKESKNAIKMLKNTKKRTKLKLFPRQKLKNSKKIWKM